jgi:hypothetical protein
MLHISDDWMAVQQRWFKFKPVDPAVSKVSGKKRKSKSKPKSQPPGNATKVLATSSSKVKVEPGFTQDDGNDDSDIEIVESVIKKTKLEVQTTDEDDDMSEQISVYISVSSAAPPITRVGTRTIKAPPPKITPRGPFTFSSSLAYKPFLSLIAKAVCCLPTSLVASQMQWKFDRPGNTQPRPLMDEVGYNFMISTIVGRHKDFVISITMPLPAPSVQDVVSATLNQQTTLH